MIVGIDILNAVPDPDRSWPDTSQRDTAIVDDTGSGVIRGNKWRAVNGGLSALGSTWMNAKKK